MRHQFCAYVLFNLHGIGDNSAPVRTDRAHGLYSVPHLFQERTLHILLHHVHFIHLEVLPIGCLLVDGWKVLANWAQVSLVVVRARIENTVDLLFVIWRLVSLTGQLEGPSGLLVSVDRKKLSVYLH